MTFRLWVSLALLLVALGFNGVLVRGDADFESVRVRMTKDSSGKGGDPKEKYWHKALPYEEQRTNLTALMQSYLSTMLDLGAETWIAHGTLLGWWWNRKIMPWDSDIDVQVSENTIHFLASYYNMTIHTCRTDSAPKGKNYMMEINPKYVDGSPEDRLNTIDGRWIDMDTGVFIDITAVRPKPRKKDIMHCKDRHEYRRSDLFPLRDGIFEGRPVKIPYNYAGLLQDEYSKASLTRTKFGG
ncbi:MAG: hypothetical protein LQ342_000384 [Letrouitia transgressa]|nr:MAG: hypothetical protein LQ342_000384 [Letrouitia transgressa]